jgi:hypothetical protein
VIRRWTQAVLLAGGVVGAAGCSALLDWNDFSGGLGDGGAADASNADASVEGSTADTGSDGAAETAPPTACGAAMQCETSATAGWVGPVELYVAPAAQGAPPSCGTGFAATSVFDGNAGLTAPPPTCSACSCGGVTGVTCTSPVMTFYVDDSCATPPYGTMTLSTSCTPTTYLGASAVTVSAPAASGGTCTTTGGTATITAPAWATVARACGPSSAPLSGTCASGEVCAPAPASPFSASECVMQGGVATACPAGYPSGPQVFYAGVDDERGCSSCECASPTGATCTIAAGAVDTDCLGSGGTLSAPSPCTAFSPPDPVKLNSSPTVADAGSCTLSGGGAPMGVANGSDATSFCCTP